MMAFYKSIFRKMMQRKSRLRTVFAVSCWVLLNAQLAVAAYNCDRITVPLPEEVQAVSMPGMNAGDMPVKSLLCDKHCTPDNAQKTGQFHLADALMQGPAIRLVAAEISSSFSASYWLTPPVTGPPAEIRFCRFRE